PSRCHDVGDSVGVVASAVACEVDGVALERRRHELGRAETAGPRALEMIRLDVAARENLQRREKFLAEIILAAADTGECRRRTDHRALADLRAVIGFDAPNRSDEVAVDTITLFYCVGRWRGVGGEAPARSECDPRSPGGRDSPRTIW